MGLIARIKEWVDRECLTHTDLNTEFTNITDNIVASDLTNKGMIERATDAEIVAGLDGERAVTPAGMLARTGTTARIGLVQLEDSHASVLTTKAPCSKNVKEAYDKAFGIAQGLQNLVTRTWTARTAGAVSTWRSVCWSPELSLFVAVANSGTDRVMTSPDGITWTARTAGAVSTWLSICWSPELSLFVAVANGGTDRVMTSPDGITWTARTAGAVSVWRSVCWSPELSLFVAVAYDGTDRVMTSPDGITWTARTAGAVSTWLSICWSPELSLFVAIANGGTDRVMTSPDGITWTARTAGAVSSWYSVCWSPELSLFVAVANGGTDRVMTSPDGITWTARTAGAVSGWYGVCWSPELSLFVAVAYNGTDRVMTSPDGITWTARTAGAVSAWLSVCWSPELSLFVAVANSETDRVMTSATINNKQFNDNIKAPGEIGGTTAAKVNCTTIDLEGGQIAFPATQAPNAGANILDDYEEGTYQPTLTCATSGSYTLNADLDKLAYTKIGRSVHVTGQIGVTGENSPNGQLLLSLPFDTADDDEAAMWGINSLHLSYHGQTLRSPFAKMYNNKIRFYDLSTAGVETAITHTHVDSNFGLGFDLTYYTN